ncbi:MAG: sodium-independent anion transporter, partial [Alphaproteobacteria bacterium]|nr:sodium-independent anion transporter [Alphaproteobacteria bacterium]
AVALSLLALLQRLSAPHVSQLGQERDSHDYVDMAQHNHAHSPPGIAIFRPNAPLFFANAERALAEIYARLPADARALILSLEESDDLDSTALEALSEFRQRLTNNNIALSLARVHDAAFAILTKAGLGDMAQAGSFSVADAVARVTKGEEHAS